MIRRLVLLAVVSGFCVGQTAGAADLPYLKAGTTLHRAKAGSAHKTIVAIPKPDTAKARDTQASAQPETTVKANDADLDMSWVLGPLVANADGEKREGSASAEGNLIVAEPGAVVSPEMVIELTGHVIKTFDTNVRIDIKVGTIHRTVVWTADEIHAGKFKISLNARMQDGPLPEYLPVSALVFATKNASSGAAMVSLDSIVVRVGRLRLAQSD